MLFHVYLFLMRQLCDPKCCQKCRLEDLAIKHRRRYFDQWLHHLIPKSPMGTDIRNQNQKRHQQTYTSLLKFTFKLENH